MLLGVLSTAASASAAPVGTISEFPSAITAESKCLVALVVHGELGRGVPTHGRSIRRLTLSLADFIRSQAEWREGKAEQHPDDGRDARSARALHGLAEAVEAMEKTSDGADLIESIEDELSRRSGGVAVPGKLVSGEVSRYGFDTEVPEPAPFLGALLSAAHADVAQEALDRLMAFVTENAVLWADVLVGNRGMMRRAAKAKAVVEELAASTGLRIELGDVEVNAKLLVSAFDEDGSGEHEFGYIASMAVDLSGPYDLRDVVADLLAGTDLRPEALTVD